MKRCDRIDFTALTLPLKLKLASHFRVGEWEKVKMQLDSRVLDLRNMKTSVQ